MFHNGTKRWRWLLVLVGCCLLTVWWTVQCRDSAYLTPFVFRFLLVRNGMSSDEVEGLLGLSDDRAGVKGYGEWYEYGWNQGDNRYYWVTFENRTGKVVARESPGGRRW